MGARLGRYAVLQHLASGGMADVMLARSDGIEGFERHVVLKRIKHEHASDQRFVRMFLDEARVAAMLHHQHIVQVYDIGEWDGEYFIAMEYVHGEDVRKLLWNASRQRTHVPLGLAISIVSAAAAGLHHAHERRGPDKQPLHIVHRDVSPSNILVGYDGSIKVVDFGVASASVRHETLSGSLKGKLSYMAPEQCRGIAVDCRADVYSLGVVLYELATTTPMIKGATEYLVMEQVVHGTITPPEVRRPDLPPELSAIIMRALATDREERYATADELRIALDAFAASAGLTASTSALAEYLRQQFGQRPEPWLALDERGAGAEHDDAEPIITHDQLPPGHSWRDSQRSSVPRSKDEVIRHAPSPVVGARPSLSAVQNPPQVSLAAPLTRATLIAAPLVLLAGVGVWWFSGSPSTPAAAAAREVAEASLPLHSGASEAPAPSPAVTEAREPVATTPAEPAPAAAAPVRPAAPRTERRSTESSRPQHVAPPRRTAMSRAEQPTRSVKPAREAPADPISATSPSNTTMPTAAMAAVTASDRAPAQEMPATAPVSEAKPHPAAPPPPGEAPTAEAPTAAAARRVVTAAVLAANRTAGENEIMPDEATRTEMRRNGSSTAVGAYKICVGADGKIDAVSVLKSSGYPAYDAKIQSTIFATWRYRPIVVDGKPGPVCSGAKISWSSSSSRLGNNPTWQ